MKNQVQQTQMLDDNQAQPFFFGSLLDILQDPTKPPPPPYCPTCRSGAHKEVRDSYAERFMKGI